MKLEPDQWEAVAGVFSLEAMEMLHEEIKRCTAMPLTNEQIRIVEPMLFGCVVGGMCHLAGMVKAGVNVSDVLKMPVVSQTSKLESKGIKKRSACLGEPQ